MSTDFKLVEKEENGQKISPVLPAHVKNYLIDKWGPALGPQELRKLRD